MAKKKPKLVTHGTKVLSHNNKQLKVTCLLAAVRWIDLMSLSLVEVYLGRVEKQSVVSAVHDTETCTKLQHCITNT